MGSGLKVQQLKEGLKILLKNKGWTYGDLAEALGCSLPTVKRILGPEELTLSRLLQICEILETTLSDLERLAGARELEPSAGFTDEQEEFLAKHPNFLAFLSLLYAGDSPEKISREFGLTKRSQELYLLRLEKHEFLSVDAKGRARLKLKKMPAWKATGPLAKSRLKSVLRRFSDVIERRVEYEFHKDGQGEKNLGIRVGAYDMTETMYRKWVEKISDFLKEMEAEVAFENKYRPETGRPTVVLSFMHALIEKGDREIEHLKTTFGEIGNL